MSSVAHRLVVLNFKFQIFVAVFYKQAQMKKSKQVFKIRNLKFEIRNSQFEILYPPVDLHLFFETSIRAEKKFQLELKKNQLVYTDFFLVVIEFFFQFKPRTEKKFSENWKNFSVCL